MLWEPDRMPFLQINAGPEGPALHGTPRPLRPSLTQALRAQGPIIIMTHGFKFAPGQGLDCPHNHILSLSPLSRCWKTLSWPRHLGYGAGHRGEGLGIAFGWAGRGTIWQAYRQARNAGHSLARLIRTIHQIAPGRPVHLIAHSLGARVVLSALHDLPGDSIRRAILLCGAEYIETAKTALSTDAGRTAEIINVTTRENDLFDFLLERLIPPARFRENRSLGRGLPDLPNTLNLQLDHPATLARLSRAGFSIAPAKTRICHWSAYLRPGVFPFYRDILRYPDDWPISELRTALPYQPDPHWTRLRGLAPRILPVARPETAALP